MENPLVQRLTEVKFDLKEWVSIATASEFPEARAKKWIGNHFDITIQASIAYMLVVFGTKYFMRNRAPFNLQLPLNAWNLFLAVFSIMGTIKLAPEFISTIKNHGVVNSYTRIYDFTKGDNGYWVWLFICSKLVELVDTIFIVLRKRPLMFLHWYHHILTLIYAFYSYPLSPGFNRYGIFLNFFVHAFMYSYYFLRSVKIPVPGFIAQFITTIQIWQFVISVAALVHNGYFAFFTKRTVDFDEKVFYLAMFMDVTYLILFINFFLKSYIIKGGKDKYKGDSKAKDNKKKA